MRSVQSRPLRGYGDEPCSAGMPCGAPIDGAAANWPMAGNCGPGTTPYQISGQIVCLPDDAVSGYPPVPYVDVAGWKIAQISGQPVYGANSYACGPGTGQVTLGPNVSCTPGGAALAIAGDGRVVLAAGRPTGTVFIPTTTTGMPGVDSGTPSTTPIALVDATIPPRGGASTAPVTVDITDIQQVAQQGGSDVAQQVVDQVTAIANSPEAAAVAASVQDQMSRNPIPFVASIIGGWYKGLFGAAIAGAVAYYLTKPKVQIAVGADGVPSLVVDDTTAVGAQTIAANAGTQVNVAGYAGW